MTDTPVNARDVPPVPKSEMVKAFIGDLARPFAIISTAFAASWATIVIAYKVENGNDGAIFAGAYFLGVGTLFLGKAVEAIKAGGHKRDVDVAQVNATGSTEPTA